MDTKKDSDTKAVERFKTGDVAAFEELMTRYENRIYSFLSRMCGGAEKAKDVVQETFLTAFRYLSGFRGDASFKTWLYRVASTSCMRSKRKRKNEPEYHLSFDELLPGEGEMEEGIGKSWYTTPVNELLNRELREHIQKSLLKLSKKYRSVFVLRDMEGLSTEEVAEVLKISEAAVKSRLHRARLFLRKELAEYYLSDGDKGGKKAEE